MKAHIELNATGTDGKVELDGVDIAKDVRSFTLTAKAGEPTVLEMQKLAKESVFRGEVRLEFAPRLRAVLEAAGWRPPVDALGLTERDRLRSALGDLMESFGYPRLAPLERGHVSDGVIWDEPIRHPMTEDRTDG